jgi:hypothetical protein
MTTMRKHLLAVIAVIALGGTVQAGNINDFLSFGEMDGTYLGEGWIKDKFLSGCHEIEEEGPQTLCSIADDDLSVHLSPRGRVVAALRREVPVIIGERKGEWTQIVTFCPGHLVPLSERSNGLKIYACEEKPEDQKK